MADAARNLFARQGFENTQVAQISAAAGVQVGQIYRDFDSKEEIVADIVRSDLEEFLDESGLESAIAAGNAAAVHGWIDELVRCVDPTEGRLLAQIIVEATRNERIAAMFQKADQRIAAALSRAITAIAPNVPETERTDLIDIAMGLLIALPQRRIAAPGTDLADLAANFGRLLHRELDRLAAISEARTLGEVQMGEGASAPAPDQSLA